MVVNLRDERHRLVSRACRIVGIPRSTFEYIPKQAKQDDILRSRLKELALKRRRWGFPRLHSILKNEGQVKNPKRTYRLYREEKLQIRYRKRKKGVRVPRVVLPRATRPNEVWSIDFVHDWLMTRRKLKCLTIVDDFTKESVGILVAHSISGTDVARYFQKLAKLPERIRSDNGPEFISHALFEWIESSQVQHEFINPGKPNENAYIESFNSRFRDECLNEHVFRNLEDAKNKIEDWRNEYNSHHPHSSLGMLSPREFAKRWRQCYPANAL